MELEPKPEAKSYPKPDLKHKKSLLKSREEFLNETGRKFRNYFKYQTLSSLIKDLFKAEKNKNEEIKYLIINGLIKLIEDINIKKVSENENLKKVVVNIVEEIVNFNEQQKGRGLKILTPKQMLKKLPIAFAQVKAGNTSEDLLNEIPQIIYSLCRAKEISKKVCNNIMNSIRLQNRMDTIFMNSANKEKR